MTVLLLLCLCGAPPAAGASEEVAKQDSSSAVRDGFEDAEARTTKQTNDFRREEKRDTLARETGPLAEAAEKFAVYMARTGKYGHEADGRTPAERARAAGYEYCAVRENIAWFESSAAVSTDDLVSTFFNGWKKSPGHRENMLSGDVSETAVAIAQSKDGGRYYAVQLFGRPASARFEVSIRNTTGDAVKYAFAGQTYELPPRVIRTHTVCGPSELRLSVEEATPQTVSKAAAFLVGEGPTLTKAAAAKTPSS